MVLPAPLRQRLSSRLALMLTIVSLATPAWADILFEGYSKILLDGTHIGFAVQRYEFDGKKQEFATTYYLKTNAAGGNVTESLKARSTASMKPISYQYTELAGGRTKTIDASFKNDTMTAVVRENGKEQTSTKKIPKAAFLASFLGYMMLQGKEGIKKDVKYGYQAIAEEDAALHDGTAAIVEEEVVNGVSAFKVLNDFKRMRFVSFVTHKGEILSTQSPVQKVGTELVATMQEATAGMQVNTGNLTTLFGSLPKGKENVIARRGSVAPSADAKKDKAKAPKESAGSAKNESAPPPEATPATPATQATPATPPAEGK